MDSSGDRKPLTEVTPAPFATMVPRRAMLGAGGALGALLLARQPAVAKPPEATTSIAPEIGSVWWVELVTEDLDRAGKFYSGVVGWSTKTVALTDGSRPPEPSEPALLMFMTEGNEVAGGLQTDARSPGKTSPRWIVYFQVENVDAAVKRTTERGGTLLIHPFDVGKMVRLAVLADLDGTPFGVAAPL